MFDKKRVRIYIKFVILLLCFFIVIRMFTLTLSRFQSVTNSNPNVDIAFYILKEDYQTMQLNLGSIIPRSEPYIYHFSIANTDGVNTAEVNMKYNVKIKTTTNLPIDYSLYLEDNETNNELNVITNNKVEKDEYDTYFRVLETQDRTFYYTKPETNIYKLVITFPEIYQSIKYENIIESIEILVDSKQIM